MDTILGAYLLFSAIVLFIVFGVLIGYRASHKESGMVGIGVVGGIMTGLLFVFSTVEYHEPKAIEVYQGKTTLEYTVKNGAVTDSVVVYKEGVKK